MVSFSTRVQDAAISFARNIPATITLGMVYGAVHGYLANTPMQKTIGLHIIAWLGFSAIMKFAKALSENTQIRDFISAHALCGWGCGAIALMRQQGIFGEKMTAYSVYVVACGTLVFLLSATQKNRKDPLEEFSDFFIGR